MIITAPIHVSVIDKDTKMPISNIVVGITIFAKQKNNYMLRGISDVNGSIVFTKEDVIREIENERTIFPMDYSSDLEDCAQDVKVHIYNEREVTAVIESLSAWKDIIPNYHDQIKMLRNARTAKKEIDLNRIFIDPECENHIAVEVFLS